MNILSFVGGWFIFNSNEIMLFIYSETNLEIEKKYKESENFLLPNIYKFDFNIF